MNESEFTVTKAARLGVVALAFLAALLAVQTFGAKPAEAICATYPDCGTGTDEPTTPLPPTNDNFSAAKGLSVPTTAYGSTRYATMQTGEPRPYSPYKDCGVLGVSNSVWFKVTPNYKGTIDVSTAGSSFDTVLALYKGSSLTSLQQVACSNNNSQPNWTDTMRAGVEAGQSYYLQLSGTGGARSGGYKLDVRWNCYYYSYDQVMCPI